VYPLSAKGIEESFKGYTRFFKMKKMKKLNNVDYHEKESNIYCVSMIICLLLFVSFAATAESYYSVSVLGDFLFKSVFNFIFIGFPIAGVILFLIVGIIPTLFSKLVMKIFYIRKERKLKIIV